MYLKNLVDHEKSCKYEHPQRVFGKPKHPLITMDRQYVKRRRFKEIIEVIDSFCDDHREKKEDVLFFLLRAHLEENGRDQHAASIEKIWKGEKIV